MKKWLLVVLCLVSLLCFCVQTGFCETIKTLEEMLQYVEQGGTVSLIETPMEAPDNGRLISIGPDGTTLWRITENNESYFAVQHDGALLPLRISKTRGAKDVLLNLEKTLNYKLRVDRDSKESDIRWSPDGSYFFFYDMDKWLFSGLMALDDPYLVDARTGEIFLIEAAVNEKIVLGDKPFRYILNGRFSKNGRYFLYYVRDYDRSRGTLHILMRYDLTDESTETVYESDCQIADFCETEEDCWILALDRNDITKLVSLSLSTDEKISELMSILKFGTVTMYPVSGGKVLLVDAHTRAAQNYFLLIDSETPAAQSEWYKIECIPANKAKSISAYEILQEIAMGVRSKATAPVSGSYINNAFIHYVASVEETPYVLIDCSIRQTVQDGLNDDIYTFEGVCMLDTDTMAVYQVAPYFRKQIMNLPSQIINGAYSLVEEETYVPRL